MLLKIATDWARENGYEEARVLCARENKWWKEHRNNTLYMKYDVTARRSGFKFSPEKKAYVAPLAANAP